MADQWFHTESGREQGPWSALEMKDLVRRGRITATTPVRRTGMTTSVPAGSVRGLLPATAPATLTAKPVATAVRTPAPPAPLGPEADASTALFDEFVLGEKARPVSTVKAPPARPAAPAPTAPRKEPRTAAPAPAPAPPAPTSTPSDALFADDLLPAKLEAAPVAVDSSASDSLFEESAPAKPKPARMMPAAVAAAAEVKPVILTGEPLRQPSWVDLWPLAVLSLLLGWICGGYGDFGRMYPRNAVLPVGILAAGGVPIALAGFFYFLRPRRVSPWQLVAVAAFTAIAGILSLLILQFVAAATVDNIGHGFPHRGFRGGFSIIWLVLAAIGEAYRATESPNILARWLGFVFGVGLCEETTKLLPLVGLIMWAPRSTEEAARHDLAKLEKKLRTGSQRPLDLPTFLCCGFASGMGFGIGEAIYCYAPWGGNFTVGMNIIRWYSAVPSHAVYTTICAAFLWKLGTMFENAEGFWSKAGVVAAAAAAMAVVHGTYDTICTLGIWPSLLMEALTFGLLVWVLRWVLVGEREAPDAPRTPWLAPLTRPVAMIGGLGAALAMMLLALSLGLSHRVGMERLLAEALPAEMKPYLGDGVTVDRDEDGKATALPISAHFRFDIDQDDPDVSGTFTNKGDAAIRDLTITCVNDDEDQKFTLKVALLAPGENVVIDVKHGNWSFEPNEKVLYAVAGDTRDEIQLP